MDGSKTYLNRDMKKGGRHTHPSPSSSSSFSLISSPNPLRITLRNLSLLTSDGESRFLQYNCGGRVEGYKILSVRLTVLKKKKSKHLQATVDSDT